MKHIERLVVIAGVYWFWSTAIMAMDPAFLEGLKTLQDNIQRVFTTYRQENENGLGLISVHPTVEMEGPVERVIVIETIWENWASAEAFYRSSGHDDLKTAMGLANKSVKIDQQKNIGDKNKPIRVLNRYNIFKESFALIITNS